jgi:hypothetical protein
MSDESSKSNPNEPPSQQGKTPEEATRQAFDTPPKPDSENQISYSDALVMAKAQIFSEALERGEYVSESMIEEQVKERAAKIMREPGR